MSERPPWLAMAIVLPALAACSGDEQPYRPPAEVKVTLQPGQRVVCVNSFVRLGLPFTSPPAAALIYWQRHIFECRLE